MLLQQPALGRAQARFCGPLRDPCRAFKSHVVETKTVGPPYSPPFWSHTLKIATVSYSSKTYLKLALITYLGRDMSVYIYIQISTLVYIYMYICAYIYLYVYICIYLHIYIYFCTQLCMHRVCRVDCLITSRGRHSSWRAPRAPRRCTCSRWTSRPSWPGS